MYRLIFIVFICVYICACVYVSLCIYVYMYIYIYIYIYVCVYICIYKFIYLNNILSSIYTYIYFCNHLSSNFSYYLYIYVKRNNIGSGVIQINYIIITITCSMVKHSLISAPAQSMKSIDLETSSLTLTL